MAITNQDRVAKTLELLRAGLTPFVDREIQAAVKAGSVRMDSVRRFAEDPILGKKAIADWDAAGLLKLMAETWNDVFRRILGPAERSLVSELRGWRNDWAHQKPFSSRDTERVLDSASRLLSAVSAPQSNDVEQMMFELRRLTIDEQVRGERRKAGGSLVEAANTGVLKAWREIVTPHPDVASGRYQQAEFAADLWQVYLGEGSDEYRQPAEFFRRTYLTQSLRRLLVGAVQRLAAQAGDPVVQLQTNFGGGKTHSMLALFHLFSGAQPADLAGVDSVLAEAGIATLPKAKRVVLVGNKISPGNPVTKPDGTVVHTLWGELAWQLGGKKAFARLAKDDERATSPGDVLRELFVEYGPCLVLIDEWVAYARQLHDDADLPAGSFETQFTFAQALTESAKLAKNCLLVVSLPASDSGGVGSPHAETEDVEVGGIRGREALHRLRNVVGRIESSWRPATAEEGFEIVRRRLFEPLAGAEAFKQRDVTARAFNELYNAHAGEFPAECKTADYEKRIQAAFPIHPEIFDRLYNDWSTLVTFQRTRGVLRLMAAVIHSLWEKGDRNPLILPSTVPIDDPRVQFEMTRYLSDNWAPIIAKDVDGADSLPMKIDRDNPNLGKLHATRRVARTIYLGSAPTGAAAHRGLEDRYVKLGCVMPSESPALFIDALRRLGSAATFLYQDGTRAWYATQPTVTKLAEDRAEQLKREPDKVAKELEARVRADVRSSGGFARVHALPESGADVPDDTDARLVVLQPEQPYSKDSGNAAEVAAKAILESRGAAPRLYRNTLVFLAADRVRLPDLQDAVRRSLAWASIVDEKDALNLDRQQTKQAEDQLKSANTTVAARLPETYQYALVPEQKTPQSPIEWRAMRVNGGEALAARVAKKLRAEDFLIPNFGPTLLRKSLDEVPLWRGDHVAVRELVDHFARYLYLPRLLGPEVLVQSIREGVSLLTWRSDTFAFAESYDESAKRYRGLRAGQMVNVTADSPALLVKATVARGQIEAETPAAIATSGAADGSTSETAAPAAVSGVRTPDALPRRFHGSVTLNTARVGADAGRISEEVIAHLAGLVEAEVRVTLEIHAQIPEGTPASVVRIVNENCRTLKFSDHGFDKE